MTKRDKIIQAAVNIEGYAVMLSEKWDSYLIGYTITEGTKTVLGVYALIGYTINEERNTVIGVYDYNRAVQLPPGIDIDECLVLEDALLDDLRAIENSGGKEFKPILVRTW